MGVVRLLETWLELDDLIGGERVRAGGGGEGEGDGEKEKRWTF